MCTTSAILDYGRLRIPDYYWTWPYWSEYQEILRRLDHLDRHLHQPDCTDPHKGEWMQTVEERLRRVEGDPPPGYQSFVTGATSPLLGE